MGIIQTICALLRPKAEVKVVVADFPVSKKRPIAKKLTAKKVAIKKPVAKKVAKKTVKK